MIDPKKVVQDFTMRLLWRRKGAYQRTFLDDRSTGPHVDAAIVLADLKRFCNGGKSSIRLDNLGKVDPHAMAVAEGRREVWLRLTQYLYLDEKTLTNLTETE